MNVKFYFNLNSDFHDSSSLKLIKVWMQRTPKDYNRIKKNFPIPLGGFQTQIKKLNQRDERGRSETI